MLPRRNPYAWLAALEQQLREEKASSLGRAAERLDKALIELARLGDRIAATSGEARDRLVALHDRLRHEAERVRWEIIVQREAIGLGNHDELFTLYPIPRRIK